MQLWEKRFLAWITYSQENQETIEDAQMAGPKI